MLGVVIDVLDQHDGGQQSTVEGKGCFVAWLGEGVWTVTPY